MKKKLLATAVAGVLASPAAMAEEGPTVQLYGRINNALDYLDVDAPNTDANVDLRNVSSRLGVRGSMDLGGGLTASAHYEFSTFTDREGNRGFDTSDFDDPPDGVIDAHGFDGKPRGGISDTRIGTVGLAHENWGSIAAGNQWSAFFNSVGTFMSPTYTLGYYLYSSVIGGPLRTSNTVKYANSFGPVNFELDTRFSRDREGAPRDPAVPGDPTAGVSPTNPDLSGTADVEVLGRDHGEDILDGVGLGVTWNLTDAIRIAGAYDKDMFDVGDDTDRIGVGIQGSYAGFYANVSYMLVDFGDGGNSASTTESENEQIQIWIGGGLGANTTWMAGYGMGTLETTGVADIEPTQINGGIYHRINGGPLRLWSELVLFDDDDRGVGAFSDEFTQLVAGFRFDF